MDIISYIDIVATGNPLAANSIHLKFAHWIYAWKREFVFLLWPLILNMKWKVAKFDADSMHRHMCKICEKNDFMPHVERWLFSFERIHSLYHCNENWKLKSVCSASSYACVCVPVNGIVWFDAKKNNKIPICISHHHRRKPNKFQHVSSFDPHHLQVKIKCTHTHAHAHQMWREGIQH